MINSKNSLDSHEWFEILKHKEHLYIIRERLDKIDPRFYTTYINLFLLIGSHSALLIDTGCGIFPLKPILDDLIEDKVLMVLNTHSHFDHIGGNYEFDKIYIHSEEEKSISKPEDISFLRDSPNEVVKRYENRDYLIPPANNIESIKDATIIDLGGLSVQIIHTPGHSTGSISLLTNKDELFTGDTAHYGTMYISINDIPTHLSSMIRLLDLFQEKDNIKIYPSHEEIAVGKKLLEDLRNGLRNIKNIWDTKKWDNFLEAWLVNDDHFQYAVFEE
jgi:glyoxylase-like metal-dependent hydrolase (beta-lactamase superfamily II)